MRLWRCRLESEHGRVDGPDESNFAKYERLGLEADKLQGNHSARRSNNNSRASVLIGAAGVGATVASSGTGWLRLAAIVFLLAAAAFGLAALRPRRGVGIDVDPLYDELYLVSREHIEFTLLQVKLYALRLDEKSLLRDARWVTWGFVLLATAILLLGAHVVAANVVIGKAHLGGTL